MKFKVGDRVRIRPELTDDEKYSGPSWSAGMDSYLGCLVHIVKVNEYRNHDDDPPSYAIKEDHDQYYWYEPWLKSYPVIDVSLDEGLFEI